MSTNYHRLHIVRSYTNEPTALGAAPVNIRNRHQNFTGRVFAEHIRAYLYNSYHQHVTAPTQASSNVWVNGHITFDQLKKLYVNVGAHETGHLLGLVARNLFPAGLADNTNHNPLGTPGDIMAAKTTLDWDIEVTGIPQFTVENIRYLVWLLEKPPITP